MLASPLRRALLGGLATLFLAPFAFPAAKAEPITVVTSFSILGDLVRQVGGERVQVVSLVGPEADAHEYEPRPSDARQFNHASLVVANGLGLDPWLQRLAASSGYHGELLVASDGISTRSEAAANAPAHLDPHAWQDVANTRHYAANIAQALAKVDPSGSAIYEVRAKAYDERLARLDEDIRSAIASLPEEHRKVVSSHDAFGYFSRAYGIEFIAPVGLSTQSEASAGNLAQLIRQLRQTHAPLFLENVVDPRLMRRVEHESGSRIGGTLYSDALSTAAGPAASYEAMMRTNLKTLLDALKP